MAKIAFTNASLTVNGVDLSDHVQSVNLNYSAEELDSTAMGDDTRINLGGLKNWSFDVTFYQDYAASKVDATLFGIVGTQVVVILIPVNATVTATNPSYTGTALVSSYNPLGNSVGDFAVTPVTFNSAGTLARATS